MAFWQTALIALAIVWGVQMVGVWLQMRHYRDIMGSISATWSDGRVGAGNARSLFGKGVILVLVVGPDDIVRRLLVMEGRSVFAKFKPLPEFEGRRLDSLRDSAFGENEKGRAQALAAAIAQIDRVANESKTESGARLATA
ncbi:transcriptional regulator GutM [Terrarubrum flagellatum]|uniref:transcriptional regulator GutM n=1 Tax=Terrirubrum flagellatum TaxID=2895980 RepID=UPI003144F4E9